MKNHTVPIVIVVIAITLAGLGAWALLSSSRSLPAAPDPISIGTPPNEASALLYIAEDRQFFAKNGLAVTIREYDPAAAGVGAMLNGEVDLAVASEYAVVMNAFNRENISILARDDELQSVYLIGRKDRGIANITDLHGKVIGVPRGTIGEFYLGRFLTLHGMDLRDVTQVNVLPRQSADAISAERLDAIVCWQPYASEIMSGKGDTVVAWPAQSGQLTHAVIVARNGWIAGNPGLVVRLLRSLDMAAEYTASHPAESQAIVQERLNLSDTYLASAWPENHFGLSLDQSLVLAMEDEARWMIANNMTNATAVPDFIRYMYTDGMEAVKPGSVNIIR